MRSAPKWQALVAQSFRRRDSPLQEIARHIVRAFSPSMKASILHCAAKKAFAINGENKFIPHCLFGLTIPRMKDSEADIPFRHGRPGGRP